MGERLKRVGAAASDSLDLGVAMESQGGLEPIAGRYEVIAVLGEGAFGRTMLCRDVESDERVALKELRFEHLDDWKSLELFEREAQVLSRLDHPGIPRVLAVLDVPGESTTRYIVQDFIEGTSLAERMERGPMLGVDDVQRITRGLLDILEYLHGRVPPVLHRDIKPSNVLIQPDGEPVLIDFGGVRSGWAPGDSGRTVVGTFGYMPPEQLLGQAGPRSDLYGLGATLLHLVSGRPPTDFSFESGRLELPADLGVDPGTARLIEALLRPAPRDRPASASEARGLLESAPPSTRTAGSSVPARTQSGSGLDRPPTSEKKSVRLGYGPRHVDVGEGPRDRKGDLADVLSNLTNPLFPARRLWSMPEHAVWFVLFGLFSLLTFGVLPVLYGWMLYDRGVQYEDLFRDGRSTRGWIVGVEKGMVFATYRYEFEVDGVVHTGFMEYAQEMASFWNVGDEVPVLYDPDDPESNCFVYR